MKAEEEMRNANEALQRYGSKRFQETVRWARCDSH